MLLWFLQLFKEFRELEARNLVLRKGINSETERLQEECEGRSKALEERNALAILEKRLQNEWDSQRDELNQKYAMLQNELERENSAKIKLEDRVRELTAENDRVIREVADARAQTVHSSQLVADFFSQQMFGRKVYGAAPELPEGDQAAEIIARPRAQARTQQMEETRKFYEDFKAGKI